MSIQSEPALRLAENLRHHPEAAHSVISGQGFGDLAGHQYDIIINATASSMAGEAPPLPDGVFAPGSLAYDMMYGKGLTPFLELAQRQGAGRLADGLGMLVEQAAESFFVWRDVRPLTAPVIAMLKSL